MKGAVPEQHTHGRQRRAGHRPEDERARHCHQAAAGDRKQRKASQVQPDQRAVRARGHRTQCHHARTRKPERPHAPLFRKDKLTSRERKQHHQIGAEEVKVTNRGQEHRLLFLLDARIKAQRIKAHRVDQAQQRNRHCADHNGHKQPGAVLSFSDDEKRRAAAEHEDQAAVAPLAAVKRRGFKARPCAGDHAACQKQKHQQAACPSRTWSTLFAREQH